MKKLLALLLALSLLLSLGGCFGLEQLPAETTTTTAQTTAPETTEATELIVPPETEPENSLPPQTDPVYQPDPDRELPP